MAGHKTWAIGEEVIQTDLQGFLADQIVAVFATAAARTAGWASPPVGAVTYLQDQARYESWNGTAWVDLSVASKGPRGEVAFQRQPSDVGLPGGAQVNLNFGPSAPLVQGRKYRATFYCQIGFTAAATVNLSIRCGTTAGASPGAFDILQRLTFDGLAGTFKSVSIIARWVHPYATGSYLIPIWGGTSAAATIVQGAGAFTDTTVEDIGV
jgi:hypothetical protein